MASIIKIAVLLVVVARTSASEYLCHFPEEVHMRCDGRGLNTPPPGFWPQITKLDLSGNRITMTHERFFTGFPALEELNLSHNNLIEMKFEVFAPIANLSVLSIAKSSILELLPPPNGTILEKLRSVDISQNELMFMDGSFFSFAPNLHFLNVSGNFECAMNHPKLEILVVGGGCIGTNAIDSGLLRELPNLGEVWVSGENISSVQGAFTNNKLLEKVVLEGNAITQITAGSFPAEGHIRSLHLRGNPLTRLDTAALNDAMAAGGHIDIRDSPLACGCGFESLFRWSLTRNITIDSSCNGHRNCSFTSRR